MTKIEDAAKLVEQKSPKDVVITHCVITACWHMCSSIKALPPLCAAREGTNGTKRQRCHLCHCPSPEGCPCHPATATAASQDTNRANSRQQRTGWNVFRGFTLPGSATDNKNCSSTKHLSSAWLLITCSDSSDTSLN